LKERKSQAGISFGFKKEDGEKKSENIFEFVLT
jgi:hypothetical protein